MNMKLRRDDHYLFYLRDIESYYGDIVEVSPEFLKEYNRIWKEFMDMQDKLDNLEVVQYER